MLEEGTSISDRLTEGDGPMSRKKRGYDSEAGVPRIVPVVKRRRERSGEDVLPVLHISVPLHRLRAEVDHVTAEEQPVLRGDCERVAHEDGRVPAEGEGHASGDAAAHGIAIVSQFLVGGGDEEKEVVSGLAVASDR